MTRTSYNGNFKFCGKIAEEKDFWRIVDFLQSKHNMVVDRFIDKIFTILTFRRSLVLYWS